MFCAPPVMDKACHTAISAIATYTLLATQEELDVREAIILGGFIFVAVGMKEVDDRINGSPIQENIKDMMANAAGIGLGIVVSIELK